MNFGIFFSTALEMHVAVTILRVQEGLDYTGILRDFDVKDLTKDNKKKEGKKGIDNPTFENQRERSVTAILPTYSTQLYSFFNLISIEN
jgi:hypothetical protein